MCLKMYTIQKCTVCNIMQVCGSCTTVCYCLSPCLSLLSSVKLCVSLAFPMADFNSPGTVER